MSDQQPSFWSTLPGILTALAGLIAAVSGLVTVLFTVGVLGNVPAKAPDADDIAAKQANTEPVARQTTSEPLANGTAVEPTAKETGPDFSSVQKAAKDSAANAAKVVNDLTGDGTNLPLGAGGNEASAAASEIDIFAELTVPHELVGHWRGTSVIFETIQDTNLILNEDGSASSWPVTVELTRKPTTGKWAATESSLTLLLNGRAEITYPFTFFEGQLVYPNIEGSRGFWEKVE